MGSSVELRLILKTLGYTPEWFDLGVVTEEYVRVQYAQYLSSDERYEEHYRARAFYDYMVAHRALTDGQIDRILQLKDDGPDRCDLRDNRITEMIVSGVLSDAQIAGLARLPEVHRAPIQRRYVRECLLRRLRSKGLTPEVFCEIADSGDGELQRVVLTRDDLCPEHVLWLAEHGANKAVRNVAKQLLQSRTLREKADDAKP
jgi:hypothetical protein